MKFHPEQRLVENPTHLPQGAGVLAFCVRTMRFLLQRRARSTSNGLAYDYFGGGVDPGETPRDAAVREIQEEGGIEIEADRLIPLVVFGRDPDRNLGGYHVFLYPCEEEFDLEIDPHEVDSYTWVKPADMADLKLLERVYLVLGHPDTIQTLKRLLGASTAD